MSRRPSPLLRVSRLIVCLVTVWCLGCSGYEPLLNGLLGFATGSAMNCASDMGSGAANGFAAHATADHVAPEQPTAAATGEHRGFACDCGGSCHAPSPIRNSIALPHAFIAAIALPLPSKPASVSRAPLLPPPEFAA